MQLALRNTAPYWLLAGAVLVAYANAFSGVFQFDDYNVIVNSIEANSWDAWARNVATGFRPLLKLTYLLNTSTGGWLPGFHAFNLLLHAGNTVLVYLLVQQFGRCCGVAANWQAAALAAALLFAVHPVHTEAVTYISGRSVSLMTLFYLSALWAYARSLDGNQVSFRYASLLLLALAVLSKESAMLFPLALLAWEWACRTPWRVVVKRQWPYWLLFALGGLVLLLHSKYWVLMSESIRLRSLHDSFLTQIYVAVDQAGKLLWPLALNIDPEYPVPGKTAMVLPQLLLLLAMFVLAMVCRRNRPWVSLGLAWLLAHLLVLNTFFPRADIANERQLYWADWAVLAALAVEIERWLVWRKAVAVLCVAACVLAVLTLQRNSVYSSEVALWEDTVKKSPNKARAWNNLGFAYHMDGRREDAVRAYCTALRLNPEHIKAYNNLERLNGKCG